MSNLRAAARQALNALEWYADYSVADVYALDAAAALRAALAKPVQEPVGYLPAYELSRLQSGHDGRLRSAKFGVSALDEEVALYTAPPQRKPLTDEEIADMWVGILYDSPPSGVHPDGLVPHRLARAIERAHGIGGQDESA